jgi:CheY-like chemotaxis protein
MAESFGEKLERILVVDDSDFVLSAVVAILECANFVVLQASSGPPAVKVAADYLGGIDLLLSDVKMPEMTGPHLVELLKETRPFHAQKVARDDHRCPPHANKSQGRRPV